MGNYLLERAVTSSSAKDGVADTGLLLVLRTHYSKSCELFLRAAAERHSLKAGSIVVWMGSRLALVLSAGVGAVLVKCQGNKVSGSVIVDARRLVLRVWQRAVCRTPAGGTADEISQRTHQQRLTLPLRSRSLLLCGSVLRYFDYPIDLHSDTSRRLPRPLLSSSSL